MATEMSSSTACRRLPMLHRDGLETNDPLTNLNSGLSTNLVLGLNSIAEVDREHAVLCRRSRALRRVPSELRHEIRDQQIPWKSVRAMERIRDSRQRIFSPTRHPVTRSPAQRLIISEGAWADRLYTTSCFSFRFRMGADRAADCHANHGSHSGAPKITSPAASHWRPGCLSRAHNIRRSRSWRPFTKPCFRCTRAPRARLFRPRMPFE